jgi:hypothetical protein
MKKMIRLAFLSFSTVVCSLIATPHELVITNTEGEEFLFEVQPEDTIQTLFQVARQYIPSVNDEQAIKIELSENQGTLLVKAYECSKAPPRDYYAAVTSQEKKDITFILKTLANNSLIKITKEKSNLKKAGDRIDNIHPFKFLETIFTDEELKVCIRNLEGKSWVWSEFRDGITSSLGKEAAVDNLRPEYIDNFAKTVNIDVNVILPTIKSKSWSKLISDLIAKVPRSGESDRYTM